MSDPHHLIVNYPLIARDVLAELAAKGALTGVRREALSGLLQQCEERLEESITRRFTTELKRLGRLREFRQVLQYDTADEVSAYLARVIPCYQLFLEMTVASAKSELTGSHP